MRSWRISAGARSATSSFWRLSAPGSAEGSWLRSAFGLVIGFSIAAAAATWGPAFFGVAAAATRTPVPPAALGWSDWGAVVLRLLTWLVVVYVIGWRLKDLVVTIYTGVQYSHGKCRVPGESK
jgi:hypothetical protein